MALRYTTTVSDITGSTLAAAPCWGPVEVPLGGCARFSLGPFHLSIERRAQEGRLLHRKDPEAPEDRIHNDRCAEPPPIAILHGWSESRPEAEPSAWALRDEFLDMRKTTGDGARLRAVAHTFGIHDLALGDAVHIPQRAKTQEYPEHVVAAGMVLYFRSRGWLGNGN